MAPLRSDSPLCRRIVNAFVDFLNSVELAPGVDTEGLEVAKECLVDVFRLGTRPADEQVQPRLLIELFSSAVLDPCREQESTNPYQAVSSLTTPSENISLGPINNEGTYRSVDEAVPVEPRVQEAGAIARDELFEQFREGLENAGFFANVPVDSADYVEQLNNARCVLKDTMEEMEKAGTSLGAEQKVLGEAFKVQGNAAMSSKRYFEAIDLYTLAISLSGDNAVYYCNRVSKGVRDLPGNVQSATSNLPSGKGLMYFGMLLATGIFFIFIALIMFLPVMVVMPRKFAICFTLGCLFIILSFFALKGPKNQLLHMASKERLPLTIGFVASMAATIYVSMVLRSYLLSVIFSGVQVLALLYYVISYFPGGSAGMRFLLSRITSLVTKCFGQ